MKSTTSASPCPNFHDSDIHALDPKGLYRHKTKLFLQFDPEPEDGNVPDPYYDGMDGFQHGYQICRRTSKALLSRFT